MSVEFNVTAAQKFFLGEDKVLDLTIFDQDGITPFDVTGLPLEWNLKKTDKASDPGIITKGITALGVSTGITIVGVYNVSPLLNTQKVRIAFASDDTNPDVTSVLVVLPYALKAGTAYRHSLKRKDVSNKAILTFGSFTFLQATER